MVWLFGQVWALCALSFGLGALVTWLVFGRRPRTSARPGERYEPAPRATAAADRPAAIPALAPADAPVVAPPVDSALAALDSRGRRPAAGFGTAATGALDLLGVGRPGADPSPSPDRTAPIGTPPGPRPPDSDPAPRAADDERRAPR